MRAEEGSQWVKYNGPAMEMYKPVFGFFSPVSWCFDIWDLADPGRPTPARTSHFLELGSDFLWRMLFKCKPTNLEPTAPSPALSGSHTPATLHRLSSPPGPRARKQETLCLLPAQKVAIWALSLHLAFFHCILKTTAHRHTHTHLWICTPSRSYFLLQLYSILFLWMKHSWLNLYSIHGCFSVF